MDLPLLFLFDNQKLIGPAFLTSLHNSRVNI
jgi:hypothetical protein